MVVGVDLEEPLVLDVGAERRLAVPDDLGDLLGDELLFLGDGNMGREAEARDVVQMAIQSLNERQRMAVLLSKFEGMSYAEIAESMGLSVQAIKSLLSRARNNLKEVLEPYLDRGQPPASEVGLRPAENEADSIRSEADRD